ncbi:ferritin-like domain-containing protein [Secundilactobacillus collinoides]|uniref:DNA-binding protein n=2 Tax=Secundilactobacillus collinoides TaxID=33960 RepID=A0A166HMV3_SECCO|nr:ferritin-like domain-containing protein [Secundilactobacillus collinoides]KRM75333.1 putative stress induced DNA binding protein (putative) [Secundilactobacillus collinoides DSM 20515 = JCM 1123]KZL42902.1 DNA-binding protein [Secundilactobacillus collinoides]
MTTDQIEAAYQTEIKQADTDHHTPTAGAMAGHIVANLNVHITKLHQAKWFLKGPASAAIKPLYTTLIARARQTYDDLADVLLDEGQLPPSTTAEYKTYAMLDEDGRLKYHDTETVLTATIKDYNTQNLFVTRAITLAKKESRPAMAAYLTQIFGENNHAVRLLEDALGHGIDKPE